MDGSSVAMVGAVVSALFSAYFIGSFAFVAYVLRKYDVLKDELRSLQARLDAVTRLERLVEGDAAKSMGLKEQSNDD